MTHLSGHDTIASNSQLVRRTGLARLIDFLILTKPRITLLVLVTTWAGFALSVPGGTWTWWPLLPALIGTALCCMAAGTLNQVAESEIDARMRRTRCRPLPSGRLTHLEALLFGLGLAAVGTGILCVATHWLAAVAATLTLGVYVLVYTPLKRFSPIALYVGAIAGAIPPLIGSAAATGTLTAAAWSLFAIQFLWQIPHFLAIGWIYRQDYAAAGLRLLPAIDSKATLYHLFIGSLVLVPVGLAPTIWHISGPTHFLTALICGLAFLAVAMALLISPSHRQARVVFFTSLIYLPLVLATMWIDRV